MTISTVLKTVYASGGDMIIRTLSINPPAGEEVRLVNGYFPIQLGVNGELLEFEPCGIEIDLPVKSEGSSQTLRFVLGILDEDRINALIESSLDSGLPTFITYREYLATDVSAPCAAPLTMTVRSGIFEDNQLGIEGSYFDMLNSRYPRQAYLLDIAPGLKYM